MKQKKWKSTFKTQDIRNAFGDNFNVYYTRKSSWWVMPRYGFGAYAIEHTEKGWLVLDRHRDKKLTCETLEDVVSLITKLSRKG